MLLAIVVVSIAENLELKRLSYFCASRYIKKIGRGFFGVFSFGNTR